MKIAASDIAIESSGIDNKTAFSIKASGKAFKILSDGLYSNKIAAVVRELCCNALDAHIAAGKKDVPFNIHIPSRFEPWFSVKDYGVGLNHEDVIHLYSTYFESTKNTSNDFVGAFGLGSKSPFSYVDSFTVTSRFNGTKRMYTSYITEEGIPNISLIHTEATTEENGIEVQVPVKDHDVNSFTKEVGQLKHFNPLPVTNILDFIWDIMEPEFEGDDWKIYADSRNYYSNENFRAVQGNVSYPVEKRDLNLNKKQEFIYENFKLDMFFKIGDLEIAASREALSYNNSTKENIRKKLTKIYEEYKMQFSNRVESFTGSEWEKKVQRKQISRKFNYSYGEFKKPEWNYDVKVDLTKFPELQLHIKDDNGRKRARFSTLAFAKQHAEYATSASDNTMFFHKDVEVPGTWIEYYMTNNKIDFSHTKIVTIETGKHKLADVLKAFGNPACIAYSTLIKPPTVKRMVTPPSYFSTAKYSSISTFNQDLPEKSFYIMGKRGNTTYKDKNIDARALVSGLVSAGLIDTIAYDKVFILNKIQQKEIAKNPEWIELGEFGEHKVDEWLAQNEDNFFMLSQHESPGLSYRAINFVKTMISKNSFKEVAADNILRKYIKIYNTYSKATTSENMKKVSELYGKQVSTTHSTLPNLYKMAEDIFKTYPLFRLVFNNIPYDCDSEAEHAVHYVTMTDNQSKLDTNKFKV